MKNQTVYTKIGLIISILCFGCICGFSQTSENYAVQQSVADMAGALSHSDAYSISDCVGQSSGVGVTAGANYVASIGFLNKGTLETGIEDEPDLMPSCFRLMQNYPNPFNPTTVLHFEVPTASHITITVWDVLGREVNRIYDERTEPGWHQIIWDGKNQSKRPVATGIYFFRMQVEQFVQVRKGMLLK